MSGLGSLLKASRERLVRALIHFIETQFALGQSAVSLKTALSNRRTGGFAYQSGCFCLGPFNSRPSVPARMIGSRSR